MEIGLQLPVMVPGFDRRRILEWARRIDTGPFSSLAAGERINFPNPEILVALSAAAAVTERVRLAFGVLVLPLHSTALVAKQVATLDVISGGRVSLGVGVGGREEDYLAAGSNFGASAGERLARLEEQVGALRRIWAGEHAHPRALRPVEPFPVQPGGPEILAGSMFPRSIRRAARWADGLSGFSFGPSYSEIGAGFELARTAWRDAGRDAAPRLVTSFWYALGDGARAQLDEYLGRYLAFMGDDAARKLAPTVRTDSASALKQAVARVADLGADELLLVPTTGDPDEVERVADLLG